MSEAPWWRHLRGDPTTFLLVDQEPGLTWRLLLEVLGRPPDSPAVLRARVASRETGSAAALLATQSEMGYWGSPSTYGARWGGTAWHVLALAALGADPEDPGVVRGAETLLKLLHPARGGFAMVRTRLPSACFTAEVCAALTRLGFGHNPRVREAVAWLASRDGGEGGWSCPDLRHLVGGCCPVCAVAVLRLGAEVPIGGRGSFEPLLRRAAGWLESVGLFLTDPQPRGWMRFGHPNLGRCDLLDALVALARVGQPPDPQLVSALELVLKAQNDEGRWLQQVRLPFGEPYGSSSRWVTMKALVALAAYGEALPEGVGQEL